MLEQKLRNKIIKKFKGKGGPSDSESTILDHKEEKDYVDLFAMASLAAKIAERCWPAVISARITCTGDGVMYKMDRKYFRGLEYCFKVAKED